MIKAYTEDSAPALASLSGHATVSEEALRSELFVLRLFGLYLGFQMGVKGPNEISRAAISHGNLFHRALTGDLVPVVWGDGPDADTVAGLSDMINMYLNDLREKNADEYRRVEEMRILAPKSEALVSQLEAYWKEIAPTRDATFQNVGTKFSTDCGAQADDLVRSIGVDVFSAMLREGVERGAQDPRLATT